VGSARRVDPFISSSRILFAERLAGDGSFSSLGQVGRTYGPVEDWVAWLAPGCRGHRHRGRVHLGGIPRHVERHGAMGLDAFLGKDSGAPDGSHC